MPKPRILLTRRWVDMVERQLQDRFDTILNEDDHPLDADTLRMAMRDFDALCPTVSDRITADILEQPGGRVRLLANYGVGVDHIDCVAAQRSGIRVSNTPGVLTAATADITMLLILMASRRAGEGERELRNGAWTDWRPTHLMGQGLSGKTLGLVGFGRIAQAVAFRARAFGMRILYTGRRRASQADEEASDAVFLPDVETLAASCDILSLHCPGGPETRYLVNARLLASMKPTAILINTARGSVVDEDALAQALSAGQIASAGLDVYAAEPHVPAALKALDNVVLLPHLGSATIETRTAMGLRVMDNLSHFFAGKPLPDHVV